ncbi:MAG: futalosine hydrolase [Bacteroidia bacterium]|nr:futalosine hydrolase [Bacteroidia bacterium]
MMKILIVAAVPIEVAPLHQFLIDNKKVFPFLKIDFLFTGAGIHAATHYLTKHLQTKKYQLIINAGIAGSFNKMISLGTVFNVISDCFGDAGAEDGNNFLDFITLGLTKKNQFPFKNGYIINKPDLKIKSLKKMLPAKSITINTASGNERTIKQRKNLYNPDLETMEGCACFYVAYLEGVSIVQLRSVSNIVEKRDRSKWQIELAVRNLNQELIVLLKELNLAHGN